MFSAISAGATFARQQAARWLRPDSQRFMRPDAARWLRPDIARWQRPLHPDERKYSPDQPRVPAGNPDGGQWTSTGGGGGGSAGIWRGEQPSWWRDDFTAPREDTGSPFDDDRDRRINDPRIISDADPEPLIPGADYAAKLGKNRFRPKDEGGHHIFPQAMRRKLKAQGAPPDFLKVLKDAKIGPIDNKLKIKIGDRIIQHAYDHAGRAYNKAAEPIWNRYYAELKLPVSKLTAAHADEILRRLKSSRVPEIRNYNRDMETLSRRTIVQRMLRGFRAPRGE